MDEFNFYTPSEEQNNEPQNINNEFESEQIEISRDELASYESGDNNGDESYYRNVYQPLDYQAYNTPNENKPPKKKKSMNIGVAIILIVAAALTGTVVTSAFMINRDKISAALDQVGNRTQKTTAKKTHTVSPSVTLGSVDKTIIDASNPVVSIAETVGPRVVTVYNKQVVSNQGFFGNQGSSKPTVVGSGAGVIVSKDGYIVTNNHVISDAKEVTVVFNDSEEEFVATVIGTDAHTDLAVLKIDKNDLTPVEFAKAEEIRVGELAVAIGNPLGTTGAVTTGIVSAVNRKVYITDYNYVNMLQTDAAINPGNSGGALVNARGQLIGICTMKTTHTTGEGGQTISAEGVGYAIPVDTVEQIVNRLLKDGTIVRAALGINCSFVQADEDEGIPAGIYVVSVNRGEAASNAGIRPGDMIIKVENEDVTSLEMLKAEIDKRSPGDILNMTIRRESGQVVDMKVELTELKD